VDPGNGRQQARAKAAKVCRVVGQPLLAAKAAVCVAGNARRGTASVAARWQRGARRAARSGMYVGQGAGWHTGAAA